MSVVAPPPNFDASLYKIDGATMNRFNSMRQSNSDEENDVAFNVLDKEFDNFDRIDFQNPRHKDELDGVFPIWLYNQANPLDRDLAYSMSRFDNRHGRFVTGCYENSQFEFKLISYKHRRLYGQKWRTRAGTHPNNTPFIRIFTDDMTIFVIEGHRDLLNSLLLGLDVIMIPFAGYKNSEPLEMIEEVRDRNVVFLIEDDKAYKCMKPLAGEFASSAKSVLLKELGSAGKTDLSDYIQQFSTIQEVLDGLSS